MSLALDLDNVLADTDRAVREVLGRMLGRAVSRAEITQFSYAASLGVDSSYERLALDELHTRLCGDLQPIVGSPEAVRRLSNLAPIDVITSRPGSTERVTREWLSDQFSGDYGVLFCEGRSKIQMCLDRGVAAIVEDKGETAFEARDRGLVSLLLDCPWNSAVPSDEMIIRVRDWPDIYQHLLTNASLQRILAPEIRKLLQVAEEASKKAHSPYSRFDVGAALKMIDGKVIAACNVESASLGLTCCAERSALFKAVSEGYRPGDVVAVGIAARPRGGVWRVATPCGACRQLLSEFSNNEFPIVVGMKAENEAVKITNLDYYLPDPFRLDR